MTTTIEHKVSTSLSVEVGDEGGDVATIEAMRYTTPDPQDREYIDTVTINAYWHTPSDPRRNTYLVIDVETDTDSPALDASGVPSSIRITLNDGDVFAGSEV